MCKGSKKTVLKVLGISLGFMAGVVFDYGNSGKIIAERNAEIRRYKGYFNTLNQWMRLVHRDIPVADYFLDRGYRTVAVYGLGELGQHLCRELCGTGVSVKYGIDRNAGEKAADISGDGMQICSPEHEFGEVDAVVVTLPHAFKKLQGVLAGKFGCPVLDLETVLFEAEFFHDAGGSRKDRKRPG